MSFTIQNLSYRLLIIAIIMSSLQSSKIHGSNRNDTDLYLAHFIQSYFLNESNFMDFPSPKCEEPTSSKNIALATFSAIVLLVGFTGNLVVVLVIQYSQLRKEPGYTLVKSLAAADLGVSIFVTSVKVQKYRQNGNFCSNLSFCAFNQVTDILFPTSSIMHLLFISINKLYAVHAPYSYHTLVTYTRENIVVICIWFYSLIWIVSGMITWDKNTLFSLVVVSDGIDRVCFNKNAIFHVTAAISVFIVPVLVAGFLYVILFMIIYEKMQATPGVISQDQGTLNHQVSVKTSVGSKKGAKTLMFVFASWVICWMPHFSLVLVNYWSLHFVYSFAEQHKWLSELISTIVSDVLPCINSCINPFIYFKTSSIFRHSLEDIYLKLMKKPRHRVGSSFFKSGPSLEKTPMSQVARYNVSGESVVCIPSCPNF